MVRCKVHELGVPETQLSRRSCTPTQLDGSHAARLRASPAPLPQRLEAAAMSWKKQERYCMEVDCLDLELDAQAGESPLSDGD
mmetsp:Transcript_2038/g.5728  ORF Transcript_2038/g.5728 Transcript_2038/m.5728 type:complete len:83 (-) Transcript_2038:563-811(-)